MNEASLSSLQQPPRGVCLLQVNVPAPDVGDVRADFENVTRTDAPFIKAGSSSTGAASTLSFRPDKAAHEGFNWKSFCTNTGELKNTERGRWTFMTRWWMSECCCFIVVVTDDNDRLFQESNQGRRNSGSESHCESCWEAYLVIRGRWLLLQHATNCGLNCHFAPRDTRHRNTDKKYRS